jgi:hypothetical protein
VTKIIPLLFFHTARAPAISTTCIRAYAAFSKLLRRRVALGNARFGRFSGACPGGALSNVRDTTQAWARNPINGLSAPKAWLDSLQATKRAPSTSFLPANHHLLPRSQPFVSHQPILRIVAGHRPHSSLGLAHGCFVGLASSRLIHVSSLTADNPSFSNRLSPS